MHRLLNTAAVRQSLDAQPGLMNDWAVEAYDESVAANRPATARPDGCFATSPAFADPAVLAVARVEYAEEMSRLRLGAVPDFDEVVASVQAAANYL